MVSVIICLTFAAVGVVQLLIPDADLTPYGMARHKRSNGTIIALFTGAAILGGYIEYTYF